MIRRDFLKLTGLFSAALVVQFNLSSSLALQPVEVESQGKRYRGTTDGKLYVSSDAGRNWNLHTKFGSEFSFLALVPQHSGLGALLEFKGYHLQLVLGQRDNIWRTA
jgi:hypothetical protein